eukprot:scaffold37999_cov60-Phaeocystis_antarctica.AAC.4
MDHHRGLPLPDVPRPVEPRRAPRPLRHTGRHVPSRCGRRGLGGVPQPRRAGDAPALAARRDCTHRADQRHRRHVVGDARPGQEGAAGAAQGRQGCLRWDGLLSLWRCGSKSEPLELAALTAAQAGEGVSARAPAM